MDMMTVLESGVIYENPLPQLKSRQAFFPSVIQLHNGNLLAAFALGEALESLDLTTVLATSEDNGATWRQKRPLYDKDAEDRITSDCCKLTLLEDGRIIAFGYRFFRDDPNLPIGNPKTGGLLDDEVVLFESTDNGNCFEGPRTVPTSFPEGTEASAPIYVLTNGDWITPIANFLNWDGSTESGAYGRLLRSPDGGQTWDDRTVTMRLPGNKTGIWEQRACELEAGRILVIAWVEDVEQGRRLPNHYALSRDFGKTFLPPKSTDIMGQASSVYHLGDNRVLSLHCIRRDTDRPGILACVVDLSHEEWHITARQMVWEPTPYRPDRKRHDVFSFMKFGQPSVIQLRDGNFLLFFWYEEEGQTRILWNRVKISMPS